MANDTDPKLPNPQGSELNSGGGAGNVTVVNGSPAAPAPSEATVLDQITKVTGLKFNSVEDVTKKLSGYQKLVGDNRVAEDRRKAAALDQILKNPDMSEDEIKDYLSPFVSSPNTNSSDRDPALSSMDARFTKLERENEKRDFLAKYPHAAEVIDEVMGLSGHRSFE